MNVYRAVRHLSKGTTICFSSYHHEGMKTLRLLRVTLLVTLVLLTEINPDIMVVTAQGQSVVSGPDWTDTGQDAVFTCTTTDTVREVEWFKANLNESFNDGILLIRFTVSTNAVYNSNSSHYGFDKDALGYPLTVKAVMFEDEGAYWCVMNIAETGYISDSMDMRVRVLPTSISISDSSGSSSSPDNSRKSYVTEGVGHQFTCVVPGINPGAVFTWTVRNMVIPPDTTNNNTGTDGLTTSTGSATLSPTWSNHGETLQCRASNKDSDPGISVSVTLDVKVPPKQSFMSFSDSSGKVNESMSHTFTCEVQDTRPGARIEWFLGNVSQRVKDPLAGGGDVLVDTTDCWTFTPVRANHRQEVKCVANTAESQQPYPAVMVTLDVSGPPDVPVISGSTSMTETVVTTLTCTADMGYPEDWKLDWSIGDSPGPTTTWDASGDRYSFTSTLNYMPRRQDNGNIITCNATKISWTATGTPSGMLGPIDIQFCAQSVNVNMTPNAVNEGNSAAWKCRSESSNPATEWTWSINDIVQSTSPQVELTDGMYNGQVSTATFTTGALSKMDNGAVLMCCAEKTTQCTADACSTSVLNVKYDPDFFPLAQFPSNPIEEGGEVMLTCSVDANPIPTKDIIWEKQGPGTAPTSDMSVYRDGTSNLTLSNIRREQAGVYACRANNGVPDSTTDSDVVSDTVTVIVHYEVNITSKANNVIGVKDGDNTELACTAKGNPEPTFMWYSPNNTEITSSTDPSKYTVSVETTEGDDVYGYVATSKLAIREVDSLVDYGTYTCISNNSIGEDVLNINLTGTRMPNEPTNVQLSERTSESLTVRWTAGHDGGEDQSFLVSYFKTPNQDMEKFSDPIAASDGQTTYTYTLTSLEPYTQYDIRVYAENVVGRNPDFGSLTRYTLPAAPSPESGITVEFNKDEDTVKVTGLKGNACIRLEVQYQGNDTWQECGACITLDQTVTLSEWCASSQKRRRRAVGDIEAVRSKLCIGGLCSETADAPEVITPSPGPDIALIVGASVGGVVLAAIIVVLVVYLVRTSPKKRSGKEDSCSRTNDIQDVELQEPSHDAQPEENNGITNEALLNNESDDGYITMENKRKVAYPVPPKRETSLPQKTVEGEIMKSAASKAAGDEPTNKVQDEMVKSSPPKMTGDEATNKVQEKPESISEKPSPSAESATEATNKHANRGDSKPPVTRPKPKAVKKYQAPSKTEVDEEIPKKKPEKNEEPDAEPTEEDGLEADTTKGPIPVKRYTVDSGDTYAQVNKTKLPPKPQSARSAPTNLPDVTYAEVNKDKKPKPPHDDYAAKKKPKKYVPPSSRAAEESAYEEVQISDKDKAKSPPAADSADTYASVGAQQDTSGRVVTEDGLIYAEVGHMKQHPVDQPPIQTEESTEYASLDFARMKPEDK